MPEPHKGESMASFMQRFMGSSEAPKGKPRSGVGLNVLRESKKKKRK